MQPDTGPMSTTTSTTSTTHYPSVEEKQFTDYLSDTGNVLYSGMSRTASYFIDRPLLSGSIIVGGIGAFLGSRLAYMLAERRRKSAYDRALETVSLFAATLGSALSPKSRERTMQRLSHASRDILGQSRSRRGGLMERIQADRLPLPMERIMSTEPTPEEHRLSTVQQIGYGLSLVPVTLALVRNPLVRDIAFRYVARRIRPGRRR